MKITRIAALFVTLMVPGPVCAQRVNKPVPKPVTPAGQTRTLSSMIPPPITTLENFYYLVAIYGYARTKTHGKPYDVEGYDNVDFYGENFDSDNYRRGMADEFERNRYRARIRAKIEEQVRNVNFSRKFTSVGYEKLGEYSFERHSFPFGSITGVNGNQFGSSLPMSEADANAFVKSRATTTGNVNRTVKFRITYSIVNDKAGFTLLNAVYTPYFKYFIYSVEVFSDEAMTRKLGVIPRINSPVPRDGDEWRLAKMASLSPTKEIGKYRYLPDEKADGKLHNPLEQRPQMFGTITLTDVGITSSGEQPSGNPQPERCYFYSSPGATIGRSNSKLQISWNDYTDVFSVDGFGCHLQFESQQERDRFFVDFTRTFREWKDRYSDFQFAAGQLTINWPCKRGEKAAPCADVVSSNEKPVGQTQTYRVTVESLERNGNKYIANLIFENLTNESIEVGWEERTNLLDADGPYLIDDRGQKYFVEGTDSAKIITSSFVGLGRPVEIRPKAKLTSRFVFSGRGEGKIFSLEAKGIDWPGGTPITIEGLKVTLQSEARLDSPKSVSAPNTSAEPRTESGLTNPETIVTDAFDAYRLGNSSAIDNLMSERGMSNSKIYCAGAAINCLKTNYANTGVLKTVKTRLVTKATTNAQIILQTTWMLRGSEIRRCQTYQLDMSKYGWRIGFFDVPQPCFE